MTKHIIKIDNLHFSYGEEAVIKNLSLKIGQASIVCLVGANGAGKSTLLKLILGLEKFDVGSINVQGIVLNKQNLQKIRSHIGYTFQEVDHQLFMPTVYDEIAFESRQLGMKEDRITGIVRQALEAVEAIHLIDKATNQMSGGEKRLVSLAVALASKPDILIMDEPTLGLDPWARRHLIDLLKKRKETIIIATHDMDMALDLCDQVVVMRQGAIYGSGKPDEIFKDKDLLIQNHLEQPLRLQACPVCNPKFKLKE